jgi:hypothetical protein
VNGPGLIDHVRVDLDSVSSEAWRGCADVLYGTGSPRSALLLLRRYPGCLLVSLRSGSGRCVTLVRSFPDRQGTGRNAEHFVLHIRAGVQNRREHALLASVLYTRAVDCAGRRTRSRAQTVTRAQDLSAAPPGGGRPEG